MAQNSNFAELRYPDTLDWLLLDSLATDYETALDAYETKTLSQYSGGGDQTAARLLDLEAAYLADSSAAVLNAQLATELNSNTAALTTANNALATDSIFQQYQVAVNEWELLLLEYGVDTLNSEAKDIGDIAKLCPAEAGPAVYQARTLLALTGSRGTYNDYANCSGRRNSQSLRPPSSVTTNPATSVYPNPVSDLLYVSSPNPLRSLELFNHLGQSVRFRSYAGIQEPRVSLNLQGLPVGMYTLLVTTANQEVEAHKIVIQ